MLHTVFFRAAILIGFAFGVLLSLFALDSLPQTWELEAWAGFGIHILPAVGVLAATILGFWYPRTSALFFVLITLVFTLYFHTYRSLAYFSLITLPPLIAGIFLWLSIRKQ